MNIIKINKLINSIPNNVKLVAVTKNQSLEDVQTLYDLGINNFGENRLQELLKKKAVFPEANWHFIGRIQSNKIKDIVKNCVLIHSVSEIRHLEKINTEACKFGKVQDILLQLNLANEVTKQGMNLGDVDSILTNLHQFPNVSIRGLMVIGNHVDDSSKIEHTFKLANKIYNEYEFFDILSMGMSNDYDIAINCNTTMVRIGSLLFTE